MGVNYDHNDPPLLAKSSNVEPNFPLRDLKFSDDFVPWMAPKRLQKVNLI